MRNLLRRGLYGMILAAHCMGGHASVLPPLHSRQIHEERFVAELAKIGTERLELKPIKSSVILGAGDRSSARSERTGDMSLHDTDDLYYAPDGFTSDSNMPYGKHTLGTLNNNENARRVASKVKILTTERFPEHVLEGVSCLKNSVRLEFHNKEDFLYAKSEWGSFISTDGISVVIITETEECNIADGDPTASQPWNISSAVFDEAKNEVVFKASPQNMNETFPDFRLQITRAGSTPRKRWAGMTKAHSKRDSQASVSLDKDFTGVGFEIPSNLAADLHDGPAVGAVECSPGSTHGTIDFDIDIQPSLKELKGNVHILARGVGASITVWLSLHEALAAKTTNEYQEWGYVPPYCGIYIKGIADFGPTAKLIMSTGFTIPPKEGVMFSMGWNMSMPDASEFSLAFDGLDFDPSINGFTPKFKPLAPSMSANMSIEGRVGLKLGLSLDGTVLGQGVSVGFLFAAATLSLDVKSEDGQSVCGGPNNTRGVSLDLNLNQDILAYQSAGILGLGVSATQTLATTTYGLYSHCLPISGINSPETIKTSPDCNTYVPATADLKQLAISHAETVAPRITSALEKAGRAVATEATNAILPSAKEALETATSELAGAASAAMSAAVSVAKEVSPVGSSAVDKGISLVGKGWHGLTDIFKIPFG